MSKIHDALYEIEAIGQMAERDQWMNRIHPLVKLFVTVLYIFLVVSFPKYDLMGVWSMAVYPLVIFLTGEVSFRAALRRLRFVLPLVCIVGIFNPFFDRSVLVFIGGVGISGGVLSMLSLMIKGVLTVLASYLLVATTTIEKLCYALRLLHVPKILVTQLLLIYRYITLLLTEARRITQAYELRAPGQKGVHFKAWGSLVGRFLLRSMDRANDVYASMCLRGYQGEFSCGNQEKWKKTDFAFLIIWCAVLCLFRTIPVFTVIGGLFV